MKKALLTKYRVTYSFYEGCSDYIEVLAKNYWEASKKAINYLEANLSTDDWDIEDIKEVL